MCTNNDKCSARSLFFCHSLFVLFAIFSTAKQTLFKSISRWMDQQTLSIPKHSRQNKLFSGPKILSCLLLWHLRDGQSTEKNALKNANFLSIRVSATISKDRNPISRWCRKPKKNGLWSISHISKTSFSLDITYPSMRKSVYYP